MNEALAWVGQIAEWFGRLIPRWMILNATEAGVFYVRGRKVVPIGPGIHWWWPATTEEMHWTIARQAVDLPTQTIMTRDGRVVAVGAVMVFRIVDIVKILAETFDPDKVIRAVAMGVVQDVVGRTDWDELQQLKNEGTLNTHLRRALRKKLGRRFGILVLDSSLTDFAPCRVLKVIQSTSTDN